MDDLEMTLAQLQPKTKAGKLRKYLPMIEQKLAEGTTAQEILFALQSHGIELTEGTFRYYLHRYRRQKVPAAAHSQLAPVARNGNPPDPPTQQNMNTSSLHSLVDVMQPGRKPCAGIAAYMSVQTVDWKEQKCRTVEAIRLARVPAAGWV